MSFLKDRKENNKRDLQKQQTSCNFRHLQSEWGFVSLIFLRDLLVHTLVSKHRRLLGEMCLKGAFE